MKTFTSSAFLIALGAAFGTLGCSSDDSNTTAGSGGSTGGGGQAGETSTTGDAGSGTGPELEEQTYGGDDPRIRYTGRVDFGVPASPRFSLPGTTVTVRFKGTGITVHLRDQNKYGTERSFYDATIDGERVAIIAPDRRTTDYEVQHD